jgi:nucleotide-binding universal stress UspA family protein
MKVLVATDGSEPARRACEVAVSQLQGDWQVRVLTVLSYTLYPYALFAGGDLSDEASRVEEVEDVVEAMTHDACAIFEKAGYNAECVHRFGSPPDEIVAEIEEWQPDLLIIGRRGVHGIERIIGSVSEHVVRRADVATLIVP